MGTPPGDRAADAADEGETEAREAGFNGARGFAGDQVEDGLRGDLHQQEATQRGGLRV